MSDDFFKRPILNSPYEYPARHWELDEDGQPTYQVLEQRRSAQFITPIPSPKKRKRKSAAQRDIVFDEGKGIVHRGSAVRSDPGHKRTARSCRPMARPPGFEPMEGDTRDGASASALAPPPVQQLPTVLLSSGSGRNGDLAHRGSPPRSGREAGGFLIISKPLTS